MVYLTSITIALILRQIHKIKINVFGSPSEHGRVVAGVCNYESLWFFRAVRNRSYLLFNMSSY